MMVKFKAIKYKHQREAAEIAKAIADDTATQEQIIGFVISIVESWDYIDGDTGQVIPLGDWQELTLDQFDDLMSRFNAAMAAIREGVKKTNNAPASYGRNGSKKGKQATTSRAAHLTG